MSTTPFQPPAPLPAPVAKYVLSIHADSGYRSTTDGRCTVGQYSAAMAALHGNPTPTERQLLSVLREAREALATAVRTNVDVEGFDVSQHFMIQKMDAALAGTSHEPSLSDEEKRALEWAKAQSFPEAITLVTLAQRLGATNG
jgi:hypothetical protein